MTPVAPGRLRAAALPVAVLVLVAIAAWPSARALPDPRPNVIVVLTDDQRWDSLEAMPWLSRQLERQDSGWASFPLAVANSPLCCPARAALLTGRFPRHTGVLRNEDGARLDESRTIATWLHDAGYRTGIVGKYLNRYPFGRLPYVPQGWDRAVIKPNEGDVTVYRDFDVVDQGSPVHVTGGYSTDWLAGRAVSFVRSAPAERPFFLLFAPSAPHPPWVPADRHVGTAAARAFPEAPTVAGALRGAPAWVEALPIPSAAQRAVWIDERRRASETLAAVDDALRAIVTALEDRLDDTVIVVLSDQGYSFGEHRWAGKRCPYESCVRIPLVVHVPGEDVEPVDGPVSTVDIAPTILELTGTAPVPGVDGTSFAGRLRGAA
ncbi:MAG TPA: sulfatase-like hydrolase/transferase, partial [Actinomycetota bacterium]